MGRRQLRRDPMMAPVRAIRRFTVRVKLPQPLAPLHDLMLNLRWSWHPATVVLFESIDPAGWAASGGDPVAMLSTMRPGQLAGLAANEDFLRRLQAVLADLRGYASEPRWYQSGAAGVSQALPKAIAYFSPEYGITAALPQYSGGLGILAGDHLKSASDLGVPLIGVGLLYRHGYFTQSLSADGWQAERYPSDDPNGLPLELLRDSAAAPVHVRVGLTAGRQLAAQIWVAQVGRIPLLLLDSYVEENEADLHEVTDRLYGGGSDHRLRQELLLGIGGMRAVRSFCALTGHPSPEVFHTNEGHAGFLGLERIREYAERGLSFEEAIEVCRAGTVFTTHTPVPAGIDRFGRELIRQHFDDDPLLPVDRVLALGAETSRCSTWPSWACGWPSGSTGSRCCTARSAGRCSRACGRASTPVRCPSARSPTACTRPPGSRRRSGCWPVTRAAGTGTRPRPPRPPRSGPSGTSCGPGWWPRPGAGCAPPGSSAARPKRN